MIAMRPPLIGIAMHTLPDGESVYLQEVHRDKGTTRISVTYPNREAAIDAMKANAVEWEPDK